LALNMLLVLLLAYTLQGTSLPHAKTCAFTSQLYLWLGSQNTSAYNWRQPKSKELIKTLEQIWCKVCLRCSAWLIQEDAKLVSKASQFAVVKKCIDCMLLCAGKAPAELCRTVCMVQIFPLSMKEAVSDCPACLGLQPEAAFQQYDVVHALLEVSIDRNSLIPLVMRLRWFPTTSGPQFADAGLQVCDPPMRPATQMHVSHGLRHLHGITVYATAIINQQHRHWLPCNLCVAQCVG